MYSIPSLRATLKPTQSDPLTQLYFGPISTTGINSVISTNDSIYVAGDFSGIAKINDMNLLSAAKLNATNALSENSPSFKTLFDGTVRCSVVSGNYLYVGGDFLTYNGLPCVRIAKISLIDGSLDTTFNTSTGFNASVLAIELDGSGNIFVGGEFTGYKGTGRQYIAKLNANDASLDTTFDSASGASSGVYTILYRPASQQLFIGGSFTSYKGTARQRIAKINPTTAALDATFDSSTGFDSNVNKIIYSVTGGSNIIVGGSFTTYKGTARQRIASLNGSNASLDTTLDTSSGFDGSVNTIVAQGSNLIIGGSFSNYQGTAVGKIVKISAGTSTGIRITAFDTTSAANNSIQYIIPNSTTSPTAFYISGTFTTYKGTTRQFIAKIDATTAALDTTFDTSSGFSLSGTINCTLLSMALYGGSIIAFGQFDNYKSQNNITPRQRIAKISLADGSIDATFDSASGFNGVVNAIALDNSGNLYAVGDFGTYKGVNSARFAKINATTAVRDTSFNNANGIALNGDATAIVIDNSGNIFVGGYFTRIGLTNANGLAKVSSSGVVNTTFASSPGIPSGFGVHCLALDGAGGLYAGGFFSSYKSVTRQNIMKVSATTAALDTTFDTSSGANGVVNSLALDGAGNLFISGGFVNYKTVSRGSIAKISASTGSLDTSFAPTTGFNSNVSSIYLDSNKIYCVGSFTTYNGTSMVAAAKLNSNNASLDSAFNPFPPMVSKSSGLSFRSLAKNGSNLYIGGTFVSYNNKSVINFVKINSDTAAIK